MEHRILVLNLGGTSTKASIYENETCVAETSISHSLDDLANNPLSREQVDYRRELLENWIIEKGCRPDDFDAVAMRSPPFPCKKSGTYPIEGKCREYVEALYHPDEKPIHGNRITLPIIEKMFEGRVVPVFLVDPPNVDEYIPEAHVSGVKGYVREPRFHALNQKAVARKFAGDIGREYKDIKVVVAHLGGGISISAHDHGRVISSCNGSEGWGPFSPDRAGTVSTAIMLDLCYHKGLTEKEAHRAVRGDAGLIGLLGTDDLRDVEKMIDDGDENAELVFNAMAFQIAEEIGARFAALRGEADGIVLTGGISYSKRMVDKIKYYVGTLAPVAVYPGAMENEALALGVLRVLRGEEEPIYL